MLIFLFYFINSTVFSLVIINFVKIDNQIDRIYILALAAGNVIKSAVWLIKL